MYLENLIQYNQALKQRNGFVEDVCGARSPIDWLALESYDHDLDRIGRIHLSRRRRILSRNSYLYFKKYYRFLVENTKRQISSTVSELKEKDFSRGLLDSARQKDLALQRTNFGIHRDDFEFVLSRRRLEKDLVRRVNKNHLLLH